MPTLLTTRRMPPELAERVRASVAGTRRAPSAKLAPRAIALVRFAAVAIVVACCLWFVSAFRREKLALEQERAEQLSSFRRASGSLTAHQRAITERARSWLRKLSGPYEGDFVAVELGSEQALAALLGRPTLYVRGSIDSFQSERGLLESAAASAKDSLLLCLLDPPSSRTEKALLAKARSAYAYGEQLRTVTSHVERLQSALVGLPFLDPAWERRLLEADQRPALEKLGEAFRRAPLEGARRAARSELLLIAMDEDGDGRGPTELDGERPHQIRVGIVDMEAKKVLLRLRRGVDPGWISPGVRAEYARAIDGCSLALDVREAVSGARAVGAR